MADSPEHRFISEALHNALVDYSETRLLGVTEAERRKFDYGCLLLRDFSRPLVSQVLWSHEEGIEKDLRTLVFDGQSSLRLYFVRDRVKNRARIDEAIKSYRDSVEIAPLLRGLRIIPIPDQFDSDSEKHRDWMTRYLRDRVSSDLLFGVVFGKLGSSDVKVFSEHGGLLGLKFAALQTICEQGLQHGPTFERILGTRGSSLREVIAMLTGAGLVVAPGGSIQRVPTLKGRFLLDLARRTEFEKSTMKDWSHELKAIFVHLKLALPDFSEEIDTTVVYKSGVSELLQAARHSKSHFGVDILKGVDFANPHFYSEFDWKKFASLEYMESGSHLWDDEEDLALVGGPLRQ